MNLESGQKWPFFPVNLSPTPRASSPLHPSLLNQLNGVSCYLPLPLSPLPPSTTLWPTCPSCSLPLVFIFQLSALDPSTPAPVLTRLTLPDGGPRILQLFACTKDCAFMALIEAPFPQSDIVPDPQDEEEWRDERVLRLLSGPFPPPSPERKGRVLTLGEMAIEVFVRRRGWKREIARVPSHFQELVGAHRERCALIDLLEVSRAEGREVVKRHGGRRIKLGELETVYPERWVKGKHYEVDWPNGPDVKKDYWDDDDLEDPTFGPTNAFKLLGFPTFGEHRHEKSRCAAAVPVGLRCTAPSSCLLFLNGRDPEPELPDGEVAGIPKYPIDAMGCWKFWISQCDEHLDQVWLNVTVDF